MRMAEMSATAEESREEIERVMVATATTLLPLFKAFVAVLVVNLACLGFGEGFVCFCNFDEFLFRGFIASVAAVRYLLSSPCNGNRTGSYQGGISCSVFDTRV